MMKRALLILALLCSPLWAATYATPATSKWYQAITIDYTKVSSTQTNFPVWVDTNSISTAAHNLFAVAALSSGEDVCFSSDSAGATQLARDNVPNTYSTGSRTCGFWVNVPSVSASSNTTFYIWYGLTTVSATPATNTYGANAVWNNVTATNQAYKAVWHCASGNAAQPDSTSGGYDQAKTGTLSSTTGQVGPAVTSFTASTNYLLTTSKVSLPGAYTITLWTNVAALNSGTYFMVDDAESTGSYRQYGFYQNSSNGVNLITSGSSGNNAYWSAPVIGSTGIHHFAATFDGTYGAAHAIIYYDSVSQAGGQSYTPTGTPAEPTPANCGYTGIGSAASTGIAVWPSWIQEVRLAPFVMPSGWIATEYANQKNPSTFVKTVGTPAAVFFPVNNPAGKGCPFRFVGH